MERVLSDASAYEDSDKALHEVIPSTYPTPYVNYQQEEDVKTMYELLDKLSREEKDAIVRVLGLGDGGKEAEYGCGGEVVV